MRRSLNWSWRRYLLASCICFLLALCCWLVLLAFGRSFVVVVAATYFTTMGAILAVAAAAQKQKQAR
jgi:uncharacterized membrane protein (DUF485 family)